MCTQPRALPSARRAVDEELRAIDLACSRFRDDSELTRVNRCAGREVTIGPLLLEAVEAALRAARITDGDVDPTLGIALELAGYDRDFALLAPPADRSASGERAAAPAQLTGAERPRLHARARRDWSAVALDHERRVLRLPSTLRLDLGATGKALAADRAARAASRASGAGVLVSLGGDLAVAGAPPIGGWQVRVTDDHRAGASAPGQTVSIEAGAIATSSTTTRRWRHRGRDMHHILDPASGMPAAGPWRTVSVAAATCVDANVASTAALVRGERAEAWLASSGLPARLVTHEGRVLRVADWPEETA